MKHTGRKKRRGPGAIVMGVTLLIHKPFIFYAEPGPMSTRAVPPQELSVQ